MQQERNSNINIVVLGRPAIGKTTLIRKFVGTYGKNTISSGIYTRTDVEVNDQSHMRLNIYENEFPKNDNPTGVIMVIGPEKVLEGYETCLALESKYKVVLCRTATRNTRTFSNCMYKDRMLLAHDTSAEEGFNVKSPFEAIIQSCTDIDKVVINEPKNQVIIQPYLYTEYTFSNFKNDKVYTKIVFRARDYLELIHLMIDEFDSSKKILRWVSRRADLGLHSQEEFRKHVKEKGYANLFKDFVPESTNPKVAEWTSTYKEHYQE